MIFGFFFLRYIFLFRTCKISIAWSIFFRYCTLYENLVFTWNGKAVSMGWDGCYARQNDIHKMINSSFSENYHASVLCLLYMRCIIADMIPRPTKLMYIYIYSIHTHTIESINSGAMVWFGDWWGFSFIDHFVSNNKLHGYNRIQSLSLSVCVYGWVRWSFACEIDHKFV